MHDKTVVFPTDATRMTFTHFRIDHAREERRLTRHSLERNIPLSVADEAFAKSLQPPENFGCKLAAQTKFLSDEK